MSVLDRTDAENWAAFQADPLAFVRELAYAHAEKLRDESERCAVIVLDEHREASE